MGQVVEPRACTGLTVAPACKGGMAAMGEWLALTAVLACAALMAVLACVDLMAPVPGWRVPMVARADPMGGLAFAGQMATRAWRRPMAAEAWAAPMAERKRADPDIFPRAWADLPMADLVWLISIMAAQG
jgi:hypothetical protein